MKHIYFFFLMGLLFPLQTCFAQSSSKILNDQIRNQVITKIGKLLVTNYVEEKTAISCNKFLIGKVNENGYEKITHPKELVKQLK